MDLSKYFDLDIDNNDLYAAGEVEEGYNHGVELINGEHYASLYHIQRHIAKGELKEWIQGYKGTNDLMSLGRELTRNYDFQQVQVKYNNQSFFINKYPYTLVYNYFKAEKSKKTSPIHAIGFKNFRRFKELEKLDLGGINLFVGQNNSGKSTVVKAILLVQEFLKEGDISKFSLSNRQLENTNIVTFGRALNADAKEKNKDSMSFDFEVGGYDLSLQISGAEHDSHLDVNTFSIKLSNHTLSGVIQNNILNLTLSFNQNIETEEHDPNEERIKELQQKVDQYDAEEAANEVMMHDFEMNQKKFNDSFNELVQVVHQTIDTLNALPIAINSHFGEGTVPEQIDSSIKAGREVFHDTIFTYLKSKKGETHKMSKEEFNKVVTEFTPILTYCDTLAQAFENKSLKIDKAIIDDVTNLKADFKKIISMMTDLSASDILPENSRPKNKQKSITIPAATLNKYHQENQDREELKKLKKAQKQKNKDKQKSLAPLEYSIDLRPFTNKGLSQLVTELFYLNSVRKPENESEDIQASVKHLKENENSLRREVDYFNVAVSNLNLFHIGTNNGSQASILSVRDRNNPLAVAAHEFFQLKLNSDEDNPSRKFVTKWLEAFEVGEDINIDQIAGEAYTIQIKTDGRWSNLSDMGMGAIQIVLLLLKLAAIIENTRTRKNTLSPTVLIEEPEINLHPKLQSMMADLFYAVQKEFALQLIVETHSEYLIRRTQLLGLEQNLFEEGEINPFKVHYFDKKDGPYEMIYQEDGKFDRKFGQGFYDVADAMAMETFKLNTKKKK